MYQSIALGPLSSITLEEMTGGIVGDMPRAIPRSATFGMAFRAWRTLQPAPASPREFSRNAGDNRSTGRRRGHDARAPRSGD